MKIMLFFLFVLVLYNINIEPFLRAVTNSRVCGKTCLAALLGS